MLMKPLIKTVVSGMARRDLLWKTLSASLVRAARYLERERWKYEESQRLLPEQQVVDTAIQRICPDLRVRHGFFQGLHYPGNQSKSSALFPKLLGTYERELHAVLERICGQDYTEIVNIGCAEGYYAVGFARRMPGVKVYAFDSDPAALRLTREMAALNGVADRVITGGFCDGTVLKAIPLRGRALIFSDCEGYEKKLFTAEIAAFLAAHDVLMEVHDGVDITISPTIIDLFQPTHQVEVIESLDDIKKARTYVYPELKPYDLSTRKILIGEGRPHIMEWLFLQSRMSHPHPDNYKKGEVAGEAGSTSAVVPR
jgi:hypothetical protein